MHSVVQRVFAACGRVVHGLWAGWVQLGTYALAGFLGLLAWVQTYGIVDRLYYKSTQLMHRLDVFFLSVNRQLYPLSTHPIKTTTNFKLN